jgi:hypothetical protein
MKAGKHFVVQNLQNINYCKSFISHQRTINFFNVILNSFYSQHIFFICVIKKIDILSNRYFF